MEEDRLKLEIQNGYQGAFFGICLFITMVTAE
jgi:hypothetical protein